MASSSSAEPPSRTTSYGQQRAQTPVDRLGVWLSGVAVRRHADFADARFGDFGCGFSASFARTQLDVARSAVLVDVALADDLKRHPKVTAIEGTLADVLPSLPAGTLDVTLCLSVLEHLSEPGEALRELRALEFAAFRLGVSPADEVNDHKRYYDPRDLWPLLVDAGFRPSDIRCHRHKFGLNTFAVCRVPPEEGI
jgi:hypothetical protein